MVWKEDELWKATEHVQRDVWSLVRQGETPGGDCECQSLLFEFLSEYPTQVLEARKQDPGNPVVAFEDGFQRVPAGKFRYGDQGNIEKEIKSPFWMHQYPVTNEVYSLFDPHHWRATLKGDRNEDDDGGEFYKANNYWFDDRAERSPRADCPVINLSWYDAMMFAIWAGSQLPDEVSWEGACRGKINDLNAEHTRFYFGNNEDDTEFELGIDHYGWTNRNSARKVLNEEGVEEIGPHRTRPVGGFRTRPKDLNAEMKWIPHPYNLWDVHGNVWEWCRDWFDESKASRVLRGGSFSNSAGVTRCSRRGHVDPDNAYYNSWSAFGQGSIRKTLTLLTLPLTAGSRVQRARKIFGYWRRSQALAVSCARKQLPCSVQEPALFTPPFSLSRHLPPET